MKSKYVMINGFAFSEEGDMEKLKNYAKEGWILEDIVGVFFYKLKKDLPQDIVYSLDYQREATEEYFTLFKEAGWTPVVSVGNEIHIFLAPAGIKPIYSDKESEIEKYTRVKTQTGRGTLYSLITAIVLIVMLVVSAIAIRPIFLIVFALFMINIFVFVFNFLPYLAYNSRIKQIKKDGKITSNKVVVIINAFIGVTFLSLGIINLTENKDYSALIYIMVGACFSVLSLEHYMKAKKSRTK